MRDIGHFIGGKPVAGTSGRYGEVFNPASGELSARRPGRRRRGEQAPVTASFMRWTPWPALPVEGWAK